MIVTCGEALIDFVPIAGPGNGTAYDPVPGGSPFNTALAASRLGARVGYAGGVSSDQFGDRIVAALEASNVELRYVERTDAPSPLAFVDLRGSEPAYAFYDVATAHRAWTGNRAFADDVSIVSFGSFSLAQRPAADAFAGLVRGEAGRRLIAVDPNIRPACIDDEPSYRERLREILARADVVKVSREDLRWLGPGREPEAFVAEWGARLVVVTDGERGSTGYFGTHVLPVPSVPVAVVDTIGAGDTFMGALLAALARREIGTGAALAALDSTEVAADLGFASRAAAITCSRSGANPPWASDL